MKQLRIHRDVFDKVSNKSVTKIVTTDKVEVGERISISADESGKDVEATVSHIMATTVGNIPMKVVLNLGFTSKVDLKSLGVTSHQQVFVVSLEDVVPSPVVPVLPGTGEFIIHANIEKDKERKRLLDEAFPLDDVDKVSKGISKSEKIQKTARDAWDSDEDPPVTGRDIKRPSEERQKTYFKRPDATKQKQKSKEEKARKKFGFGEKDPKDK